MRPAIEGPSHVAHFFSRLDRGGAELRTLEVVESTRYAFDFFAVSGAAGALDNELEAAGHRVHHINWTLAGVVRIARVLRQRQCRVLHSHLGVASGPLLLAGVLAGVRTRIVHFRSDAVGGRSGLAKRLKLQFSRWLVARTATKLVGVSPGALGSAWRVDWQRDPRCEVIPNGLDAAELRRHAAASTPIASQSEHMVLVNVGRPDPDKNRGRALQIGTLLQSRRPTTLILVGGLSDADQKSAARAVFNAGLEVITPGKVESVAPYVVSADALVLTSRREGLPGVVLEALALGTPVVASDLPGVRWIHEHLQGLTVISLSQPDEDWVSALLAGREADRQVIRESFDAGPFVLAKVVPRFARLWGLDVNESS